ncbi:hypothetical protein A2U01_0108303, partial [Trifolium medium]|nr:hypothetical protein [Trifolium medium]
MRVAQADMARRTVENFKSEGITVTCALRRADGAARQHQFSRNSKDGTGVYKRSTGLTHCQ